MRYSAEAWSGKTSEVPTFRLINPHSRSDVNRVHPQLRSQKLYEQMFGAPISTCMFSVEKLCYSKNSIASRLFLPNGRYLINY